MSEDFARDWQKELFKETSFAETPKDTQPKVDSAVPAAVVTFIVLFTLFYFLQPSFFLKHAHKPFEKEEVNYFAMILVCLFASAAVYLWTQKFSSAS